MLLYALNYMQIKRQDCVVKKISKTKNVFLPSMNIKWSIPYLVSKVRPIKCLNISGL